MCCQAAEHAREGSRPISVSIPFNAPPAQVKGHCLFEEGVRPSGAQSLRSSSESACLSMLQVKGYCMFKDGREAKVDYPTEGLGDDIAGRSFHHGRWVLVRKLLLCLRAGG